MLELMLLKQFPDWRGIGWQTGTVLQIKNAVFLKLFVIVMSLISIRLQFTDYAFNK